MSKANIAIIQARIGSSRLPGKMFKRLGRYYLIEWVIMRLKKSKKISKIILATTTKKSDKKFINICRKFNITFFSGSENDVLGRFYNSVKKIKNANIVRVCADNPFIDPIEVDNLISFFNKNKYDYACNHQNKLKSGYADGFGAEILSIDLLKKLNQIVKEKNLREHVTQYIWKKKNNFKIHSMKPSKDLSYPKLRFDVNTLNDLRYLSRIGKNKININTTAKKIIKIALEDIKNKN